MENVNSISSSEQVARILSNDWIVDGKLLSLAFTLRDRETYISVNRPSIETYDADVTSFVESHPKFKFDDRNYMRALLSVGEIRDIEIDAFGELLNFGVEVEPRDSRTKSHAGIFVRYGSQNVKNGDTLTNNGKGISADDVLLKVRTRLMNLSVVEQKELIYSKDDNSDQ